VLKDLKVPKVIWDLQVLKALQVSKVQMERKVRSDLQELKDFKVHKVILVLKVR
jgi:hypothetical protein